MKLGVQVGLGSGPQFSAHFYCGQTDGWIKMVLGMEVFLCAGHIVPSSSSPKRGQSPQFSAHFYCGQTAGWIKMPLGTEVGLGPGDILLDGDPSPPKRGTHCNFRPMSVVAKWLYASQYHLIRR